MKYFTKNWHESIQKTIVYRSSEVEREIEKSGDDYREHYKEIEQYLPNCIKSLNKFDLNHMHDCIVKDSGFNGKDFYMDIVPDNFCVYGPKGEDDEATIDKLTFVNAQILEMDGCLNGGTWLYDEVYLHQGRKDRYEMHILFHAYSEEPQLGEMVIVFDKIIIQGNWTQV